MPQLIPHMPPKRGGAKPEKYPWPTWLDGRARRFRRGVDFAVGVRTFRTLAERAAATRGMVAVVVMDGGDVYLQARKVR